MLNCGITWSFLVVIKAPIALLSIMIDSASVKETNESPLQEGNIFKQNLISDITFKAITLVGKKNTAQKLLVKNYCKYLILESIIPQPPQPFLHLLQTFSREGINLNCIALHLPKGNIKYQNYNFLHLLTYSSLLKSATAFSLKHITCDYMPMHSCGHWQNCL